MKHWPLDSGVQRKTLVQVCLCRAPAAEEESFQDDIQRIASKFSVDGDKLAEAVRRGQAIYQLVRGGSAARPLIAARDGEAQRGFRCKEDDAK